MYLYFAANFPFLIFKFINFETSIKLAVQLCLIQNFEVRDLLSWISAPHVLTDIERAKD